MAIDPTEIRALPGGDLVGRDLTISRLGRESIDAPLVSIGAPDPRLDVRDSLRLA